MRNGELIKNVSLDDLKIDAPVTLARYVLASKTLREKPEHRALYKMAKEMDKKHEKLMRMTAEIETKLGLPRDTEGRHSGVSMRRRTVERNKPRRSRKAKKTNIMGSVKYGIYVPKSVAEALRVDKKNNNNLWQEAIVRELSAIMSMGTFKLLKREVLEREKGQWQYAPLRIIFDVKQDTRRKARLVLGGHVLDSAGLDLYASNMKTISARALMIIASANKYDVLTGDIGNAYLYALNKQKIYVQLGQEFNLYDSTLQPGSLAQVVKAQYGGHSSANSWHAHLSDTLLAMQFRPTRYDPDVWIRPNGEDYYDYIGTHSDDLTSEAVNMNFCHKKDEANYKLF
jgi:hypothetical protein